jgi:putative glycosyltransferase (TIGR04372 family)
MSLSDFIRIISDPFSNKKKLELLYFPAKLFLLIVNFILFIIFKIFSFKLLTAPLEAIGHQIFDLECFFYEKKKLKYKFTPIILTYGKFIANKYLLNYQRKLYNFYEVNNKFLCILLYFQKNFKNITFNTNHYVATRKAALCYLILKRTSFFLKLKSDDIKKAELIIKKKYININVNKKIVILHVRDNSFKPYDNESYRSSNINNFDLAINYLIKKKYQIIRIGNPGMDRSYFNKKILDISPMNFDEDTQLLQMYLVSRCSFFIGTCSGPYKFATIFKKPILTVDMAPAATSLPVARRAISIPKLYYSLKLKKILHFKDVFGYNFSDFRGNDEFKKNDLRLLSTQRTDILEAVKEIEMLSIRKKIKKTYLQKKYKNFFSKNSYAYYAESSISNSFAKKYKHLIV